MKFWKISAAGNDFVLLYGIEKNKKYFEKKSPLLCDRHYGIGADGVLVINKIKSEFYLDYYNSDGTPAFCGNGTRSAGFWLYKNIIKKNVFYLNTVAGRLLIKVIGDKTYVRMPDPEFIKDVSIGKIKKKMKFVRVGTNHLVIETRKIDRIDAVKEGRYLRYHPFFKPEGTNVDFVEVLDLKNGVLKAGIRTYEKGVEDETYSCSSGITSAFYALREKYKRDKAVFFTKKNEKFEIFFKAGDLFLSGPVKIVFRGEYELF